MPITAISLPVLLGLAFIWGSIWGSFANVVIHRLPLGKSVIYPGSSCPACGRAIRAWNNIPILSYLFLRGRCADCKAPFSARYALVELASGLLGAGALWHVGSQLPAGGIMMLHAVILFFFLWLLLVLALIDWDTFILPDKLTLGGCLVFAVLSVVTKNSTLVETVLGSFLGFFSFASVSFFYRVVRKREGLGLGDAKLLALIGAFTGPLALIPLILFAALQGLLAALVFLVFRLRRKPPLPYKGISEDDPEFAELFLQKPESWMLTPMPFGPFLSVAAMQVIFTRPIWHSFLFEM